MSELNAGLVTVDYSKADDMQKFGVEVPTNFLTVSATDPEQDANYGIRLESRGSGQWTVDPSRCGVSGAMLTGGVSESDCSFIPVTEEMIAAGNSAAAISGKYWGGVRDSGGASGDAGGGIGDSAGGDFGDIYICAGRAQNYCCCAGVIRGGGLG